MRLLTLFLCALLALPAHARAPEGAPVRLEDMTWLEVKDRMAHGATTVIVPTGGTEQNGPHIIIGKHNAIMRYTGDAIARKLGNALVAPVVAYVPEGRIDPPEGHMKFPGTISVSDATLAALLEDTASSLKQHGFRLICFVGDHGGSQEAQRRVAEKLTARWKSEGVRVLHVANYYQNNGQEAWVKNRKLKVQDPSAHAGFFDTSEMLALGEGGVRTNMMGPYNDDYYATGGASGDPRAATATFGQKLLSLKVDAAVDEIQRAYLQQ